MKLLLFKSKTCGPCKMFEPQVKKVSEDLDIEYIPIDVAENETFHLWKDLSTSDLLTKYSIESSGTLVVLIDETKEDGPTIIFNRPTKADEIEKYIKEFKN